MAADNMKYIMAGMWLGSQLKNIRDGVIRMPAKPPDVHIPIPDITDVVDEEESIFTFNFIAAMIEATVTDLSQECRHLNKIQGTTGG